MPKVDPNPPDKIYQEDDFGRLRYRRRKGSMDHYENIPVGEYDDLETYEYS